MDVLLEDASTPSALERSVENILSDQVLQWRIFRSLAEQWTDFPSYLEKEISQIPKFASFVCESIKDKEFNQELQELFADLEKRRAPQVNTLEEGEANLSDSPSPKPQVQIQIPLPPPPPVEPPRNGTKPVEKKPDPPSNRDELPKPPKPDYKKSEHRPRDERDNDHNRKDKNDYYQRSQGPPAKKDYSRSGNDNRGREDKYGRDGYNKDEGYSRGDNRSNWRPRDKK